MPDASGRFRGITVPALPWKGTEDGEQEDKPTTGLEERHGANSARPTSKEAE